jgi:hypothetical protein
MEDEYLQRRQTLDFLEKQLADAAPGSCRSEPSSATSMHGGATDALSLIVPPLGVTSTAASVVESVLSPSPEVLVAASPSAAASLSARSSDDALRLHAASAVEFSTSSTPPAIPFPSATHPEWADADKDVLAGEALAARGVSEEVDDKNKVAGRRRKNGRRTMGFKNRAAIVIKRPGGGTDYWPKGESAPARLAREIRPYSDAERGPGAQIGERLLEWWHRMSLQR